MALPDFERIADALAGPGWIVVDAFIESELATALASEASALVLAPARVGAAVGARHLPELRGDRTHWIDAASASAAQGRLLGVLEALRLALNAALYAGLEDVECHFAHYAPGARYGRHLDRFRDNDRRVVSCVLYLNADWPGEGGGELRLYADDDERVLADVAPVAARAVLFLSDRFPHEVLPANRDRYSIAAWFLRRARSPG